MQLNAISKVVSSFEERGLKNIIIMGDFNSTNYILKNKNHKKFVQKIASMNLIDSTKDLSCSSYWWGGKNDSTQYPSTLDHIIISNGLSEQQTMTPKAYGHCAQLKCKSTKESAMGTSFDEVSDHCPILTEIK
jgi:endonuclease/exonuclease/phosphatase family metal-dependent hydrolase